MAEKSQKTAVFIGGGVVGFLLCYLLRRKAVPTGVTLGQLQIAPATAYPGDEVRISCVATNRGEAASFPVIATVGNNILEQAVFLEPGIPTEVVFVYTVPGLEVFSRIGSAIGNGVGVPYYVTVSVGDLKGSFAVI